jgi:hypothetical protein
LESWKPLVVDACTTGLGRGLRVPSVCERGRQGMLPLAWAASLVAQPKLVQQQPADMHMAQSRDVNPCVQPSSRFYNELQIFLGRFPS